MPNDVTQLHSELELDLIHRAIAKEDVACTLLVSYYQPRLVSYVAHIVGDTEAARDIVQEVFSVCFSALHRWRPPSSFLPSLSGRASDGSAARTASSDHPLSPWLYTLSTRKALNWLRREKRSQLLFASGRRRLASASAPSSLLESAPSTAPAPEDAIIAREVLQLTLRRVSPLDAACVVLRFVEEESYQSIASRLGLTVEAARKRVARALPLLRRHYLQITSEESLTQSRSPSGRRIGEDRHAN